MPDAAAVEAMKPRRLIRGVFSIDPIVGVLVIAVPFLAGMRTAGFGLFRA